MSAQVATQDMQERIIAMDEQGYSHKPLVRVELTDYAVTKALDRWGQLDSGMVYVRNRIDPEQPACQIPACILLCRKHAYLDPEQYACWMTDPEDLRVAKRGQVGTSCVLVEPIGKDFIIQRHNEKYNWAAAFKNTYDTFFETDRLTYEEWRAPACTCTFDTFDEACQVAENACAWESNNRKALAEYRAQRTATAVATADKLPKRTAEDASARWSKDKKKAHLIEAQGSIVCCGCGREFDHPDYLEVDHIRPRVDGGANSLYNLALLCRPCNSTRRKGGNLTMHGLREKNRKDGFMVAEIDIPIIGFVKEEGE